MHLFLRAVRSELTISLAAGFLVGAGLFTLIDGKPMTADAAVAVVAPAIIP